MENIIKEFKQQGKIFNIVSKNEKMYELEDKEGKRYKVSLSVLATYQATIIDSKIMINEFFLMTNSMICKFDAFMFFLYKNTERFSIDKEVLNEFALENEVNKYIYSNNEEDFIKNILSIIYVKQLMKDKLDINFFKFKLEIEQFFKEKKEYKILSNLDLLSSIIIRNFHLNTTSSEAYEIIKIWTYNKKFFDLEYFIKDFLNKNEIILKKVPFN